MMIAQKYQYIARKNVFYGLYSNSGNNVADFRKKNGTIVERIKCGE